MVCRELGLGYATAAVQSDFFGGNRSDILFSGVTCRGNEDSLVDCHHEKITCPGRKENIAGVVCNKGKCVLSPTRLLPPPALSSHSFPLSVVTATMAPNSSLQGVDKFLLGFLPFSLPLFDSKRFSLLFTPFFFNARLDTALKEVQVIFKQK